MQTRACSGVRIVTVVLQKKELIKFRFAIEDNISEDNKIDWEIKLLSRHGCN